MIQFGKVISASGDTAMVEIIRESACSGCHNKDSCGASVVAGCGKAEKVTVKANNLSGAVPGDRVELTSNSSKAIGIAFCVFILPLLIGFVSYYIFNLIFSDVYLPYIVAVLACAFSFFVLFFGIDRILSKTINVDITGIVNEKGGEQENFN